MSAPARLFGRPASATARQLATLALVVFAHWLAWHLMDRPPESRTLDEPIVLAMAIMPVEHPAPAASRPSPEPKSTATPQPAQLRKPKAATAAAPETTANPAAVLASTAGASAPPATFEVAAAVAAPAPLSGRQEARFDADYLDHPRPRYPPLSRRLREQGRVVLRVAVTAGGQAERLSVEVSSGFARLDEAAVSAVAKWRFLPARQGDRALAAEVLVPIVFTLKE